MSESICDDTAPPKSELPGVGAARRITEGLDLLVEQMYPLAKIVQAFKELLVERASFKAELRDFSVIPIQTPDPWRFETGVPLLSVEKLIENIDDILWIAGAKRLIPVMENSFPKVKEEIEIIANELFQGRLDPRAVLKASVKGDEGENKAVASRLKINPQTLAFVLGQVAKPLLEKASCSLSPLVKDLSWRKGYCPICGTMPELAFLRDEGGQRWLRCATCSYEWRFMRLMCPFCENDRHQDFETYFVVGKEYESLDICNKCKRYVPTIDLRNQPKPIAREVAAMALMHLDVIAQEKGFLPVAVCAWNIVRGSDVLSMPVR